MRPNIIDLRQFYSSVLGRKVKQRLARGLRQAWQRMGDDPIIGIGYATPFLRAVERTEDKMSLTLAVMPVEQGAIYWPVHTDNRSVLCDMMQLPFAANHLQRVVMVHALEHAAQPGELLAMLWELMAPGARLVLVVPNRRGVWAHWGATPFASGTAYAMPSLCNLLVEARFTVRAAQTALFAPPSSHPFWMNLWSVIEWLGRWCTPTLGGVLVVEAEKQIYASVGERVAIKARSTAWAAQGRPIATSRTQLSSILPNNHTSE